MAGPDGIDDAVLVRLRRARATARERAWAAGGELTGGELLASRVADRAIAHTVIDVTLVEAHSEKAQAAPHYKGGFGFHPLLAYLDNTGEVLAGVLRPGNAAAHDSADHMRALAQLPETWRAKPILIRADTAGASHTLVDECSELGLEYSIGFPISEAVRTAISRVPAHACAAAIDAEGEPRDGADVAEITGMLNLGRWLETMRVIVRRDRPHPGAQVSMYEERDGWRYQAFITSTAAGQLAFLDAWHSAHARVEDRIRTAKSCGLAKFPSQLFHLNAAWLELALAAADLGLLADERDLARAEPRLAALQAAAHRCPHHPRLSPRLATPGRRMALGARPGPRVRTATPDRVPCLTPPQQSRRHHHRTRR